MLLMLMYHTTQGVPCRPPWLVAGRRCLLFTLPIAREDALTGSVWIAIVYAGIQDGRHTHPQRDMTVTLARLDALCRRVFARHSEFRVSLVR